MAEPYLGEIRIFPWDWPPVNWAACDGSNMDIWQYQGLYAIISNAYGGDGQTYFKLPNMRGRAPMHWGTSTVPGISSYAYAMQGGQTAVNLTVNNLPNHNHNMTAVSSAATTAMPANNLYFGPLQLSATQAWLAYKLPAAGLPTQPMNGAVMTSAGSNNPMHSNQQPLLALNFCIALNGTWPLRQD